MVKSKRKTYYVKAIASLVCIFTLLPFIARAQAPSWQWVKGVHSVNDEYAIDVAVDPTSGDVVSVGVFNGGLGTVWGSNFVGAVGGGFVSKYDAAGNFVWAFPIGNNQDDACIGVTVDATGNIYVTGYLQNTAEFKGNATTSTILTSVGGSDIFLAKYNSAGQLQWVHQAGGTTNDEGIAVAVNTNKVFITGFYTGNASFGTLSTLLLGAGTDNKNFVAAYDLNGNQQWVTEASSGNDAYGEDICADNNHVYVTGNFYGATLNIYDATLLIPLFPSATISNANASSSDGFALSFAAATGAYHWSSSIHSASNDYGIGIIQGGNNVYLTGSTSSSASFTGYASNPVGVGASGLDLFVAQLDKTTGTAKWVKSEPGTSDEEGMSISMDTANTICLTGYFKSALNFTGGTSITSTGNEDVVVAAYDTSGNFLWANQAGNNGTDIGYAIATGPLGGTYVAGEYEKNAQFGGITLIQDSPSNIFLARMGCPPILNNFILGTQAICIGNAPDSLRGPSPLIPGLYTYLWEQSTDTTTWTTAVGTYTNQNYLPPTTTSSIFYHRIVTATYGCSNASTSNPVLIAVNQMPTVANAGSDQTICSPTATLIANNPLVGTGHWSKALGNGVIATPNKDTTLANGLGAGPHVFVWTIVSAGCISSTDTVKVMVDAAPTIASGASNQNICASTTILSANSPTVGTGVWSVISGGGIISSANNYTTSVSGLSIGQNFFLWSITNGVCPASTDTFKVKVDAAPSAATAGGDQNICASSTTLSATSPAIGTGSWHVLVGSSTVISQSTNTTSVMGLTVGLNSFEWVVSNGVCPVNIDTVKVKVSAAPSAAVAGSDKNTCASSYTLNATVPSIGNGVWNVLTGTSTVTTPTLNNSGVTNLSSGVNLFEWVVSNGVCPSTKDTVAIKLNTLPSITITTATNAICAGSSITLTAGGTADTYTWTGGPVAAVYSVTPTNSITYTVTGTNTVTTCSNTAIKLITVKSTSSSSQTLTICHGQSQVVGTSTYSVSGTYTDILTAVNGCDSTVTTHLTVRPAITNTQSKSVCNGQSYIIGTHTYTATGIYTDVLTAANGCDSTVTTHLTVKPAITSTQSQSVCNGQSYVIGTHTYTTSGTYVDMLTSVGGCDSTVTTHLTVSPAITSTQAIVICNGFSYSIGTHTYTASGVYTDVLTASKGCDSTVTTNLTVRGAITSSQNFTICAGQNITVGTNTYTANGVYTNTFVTSSVGCDSVVTTNLTVNVLPTIANAGRDTIIYNPSLTLTGNVPSVGVGVWSVVSGSGNFSNSTSSNTEVTNLQTGQNILQWTITNGPCTASFDDILIVVKALMIPNGFSPNGDAVNDNFEINGLEEFTNVKLNVFNRWGNLIYDNNNYKNNWNGKNMSGEDVTDDTYFYTLDIPGDKKYNGYVVLKRK